MNFNLLFLTLFVSCALAQNATNTTDSDDRVLGGIASGPVTFQVSLRNVFNAHFCGGAIIEKRWILTAASCVERDYPLYVRVGSNFLDKDNLYNYGEKYFTSRVIVHQYYDPSRYHYDIAMIQTIDDMQFKSNIQPVRLPIAPISDNAVLLATGWGWKSFQNNQQTLVENLQVIPTRVVTQSQCYNYYQNRPLPSQMCTFTRYGQGFCNGDFGGPLAMANVLHGIISYSVGGCATGYPDVSTRVYSFTDWIKNVQVENQ